ncbi:hypothetical protein SAMN05216419_10274 [Nitrosomonas cryotolerans]|uniref:Uncharacterized protein n=1 Tax=Nitrosomonas cryotolerans ATCC 49181 TaxID=1131553 RepID=A0A1N6H087_9PROT|nr:hypothetical protein [Nitrosomonas cryotolerans]SFP87465.1 hypothetical protein SAMN05216419_10274 [Nitrosomonas cryotolerans]SIO13169.1 hypothetical protein SAMN02743940_0954 [Nitrosomonas cryotolerans ATCC 49181]
MQIGFGSLELRQDSVVLIKIAVMSENPDEENAIFSLPGDEVKNF